MFAVAVRRKAGPMPLPDYIPNADVFITVKTYPTLSAKYGDLVCTAGICQGQLVRIYPIKFRRLEEYEKYAKYQWIKVNLKKRSTKEDQRLESYSPDGSIALGRQIGARLKGWEERMKVIRTVKMHDNLENLIKIAKTEPFISLAALRPKEILDFTIKETTRDWTPEQKSLMGEMW